jgi:2-isopropylmalate synthase
LLINQETRVIESEGQGVLDAFIKAINTTLIEKTILIDYSEHTLGNNEQSDAIAYVQISVDGQRYCGVGKSNDIIEASLFAIVSARNRAKHQAYNDVQNIA